MTERKERITVSLPAAAVEQVRAAVAAGEAPDVSAYVADALQARARRLAFDQEVWPRIVADVGEPSTEHYAWAAHALGLGQHGGTGAGRVGG